MNHATLIERFREHEELAEKFHQLDTQILSVLDFKDFFQVLLEQIADIFAVPHVWLSLLQDKDETRPILRAAEALNYRSRLQLVSSEVFAAICGSCERPVLENEGLDAYFPLLPTADRFHFRSLALVPVTLYGQLIGSLNLADPSSGRYRPGYNPIHLERLAVKVSLCLSNVSAHENLQYLAYHDPLTQLYNRRALEKTLEREFSRSQRYRSQLCLAFVDLDRFKTVNDSYGHDCGDALLQFVANGMSRMLRQSDIVSRLAGDEFVLLLPETGTAQAEGLLARMAEQFIMKGFIWQEKPIPLSISYGIASLLEDELGSPAELLKRADERLYRQKRLRD